MSLLALAGWLCAGLAGLVLLALVVVLAPFRLSVRLATEPPRFDLSVGLLGGWLPEIRLARPRRRRAKPPAGAASRSAPAGRRERSTRSDLPGRALHALPQLILAIPRALRIDRLRLHAAFGTGDPALTGEIYGALTPLIYGTAGVRPLDLQLLPDFTGVRLAAEMQAVLRVAPLALIGPVLRFGWACFGPRRHAAR